MKIVKCAECDVRFDADEVKGPLPSGYSPRCDVHDTVPHFKTVDVDVLADFSISLRDLVEVIRGLIRLYGDEAVLSADDNVDVSLEYWTKPVTVTKPGNVS